MRSVLYLRISDESQRNNTSLETQEAACRAYCQSQQFQIVDIVKDEAISANKNNMQRVIELLDYCKEHQGKFDILVVFNLSRFARSQEHHQLLRSKLKQMNIILRSASERIDESATGKLIEGVLASVNEYDNDIRTEKTKMGMTQRLREGLFPWKPPQGYFLPKVDGIRLSVSEIDTNLSQAFTNLFEMYVTGMYTYSVLAKKMNQQRLVNYRGVVMHFSASDIEKILKNPFYCGILRSSIDPTTEYEGKHQPLISKQLWNDCQNVKFSKGRRGAKLVRKQSNPDFFLRGLLFSERKHKFTAAYSRGNGGKYGYYFCQHRDCGNHKACTVHEQFLEMLESIQPASEDVDLYLEIFEEKIRNSYQHKEDEIKRMTFAVDTLKQKKANLMEMRMNSEIEGHEFVDQNNRLNSDILAIESDISSFHQSNTEWRDVLDYGKSYITDIRGRCESLTEVDKKLAYIGSIFPVGVVYNGDFLSNQQTLEIITVCNAQKRANVTPWRIELQLTG